MFQTEHLQEKWQLVLEHPDLPKIEDSIAVQSQLLSLRTKKISSKKIVRSFRKVFQQVTLVVRLTIGTRS